MLTSNQRTILREVERELEAMQRQEQTALAQPGPVPEMMVAAMNVPILSALRIQVNLLVGLAEEYEAPSNIYRGDKGGDS